MSVDRPTDGARRGLAGRVLGGRYRVVRMVSAGANTLIADADDLELGRPVTVKLVRPEIAESEEFRRRFARTMRAMAKLSHPNIAAVHDWGEEEVGKRTTTYAVVEHLSGGSLRDLFDRGRHLDPSQALVVGLEVCRGLDFAHRKNLVHGELTPAKLVFGDDRRLRIVDFGLARLLTADDWNEPSTVPTHVARYSSPEQALGQPIDGRSDVYALALILVEAVTGTVPFAARSTVATLSARVGRLMPVSADLGPLASVLERAGRPDPTDRSSASEFGRSLVRAAEKLPRPAPIPIVVTKPFEDDSRLRRPNDPTGGLHRPADEPGPALVPPGDVGGVDIVDEAEVIVEDAAPGAAVEESPFADAPIVDAIVVTEAVETVEPADPAELPESTATAEVVADLPAVTEADVARAAAEAPATDPVEPTAEAAPEEHAAGAALGAAAAAAAAGSLLPPPPPPGPPKVYDGDEDLLRDELALLAQLPDAPAASWDPASPSAPPTLPPTTVAPTLVGGTVAAAAPRRRKRRWVPWVIGAAVLVVALAVARPARLHAVRGPDAHRPRARRQDRAGGARRDGDVQLGRRGASRAQRRGAHPGGHHPHGARGGGGARRGGAVPDRRQRRAGVPHAAGLHRA